MPNHQDLAGCAGVLADCATELAQQDEKYESLAGFLRALVTHLQTGSLPEFGKRVTVENYADGARIVGLRAIAAHTAEFSLYAQQDLQDASNVDLENIRDILNKLLTRLDSAGQHVEVNSPTLRRLLRDPWNWTNLLG